MTLWVYLHGNGINGQRPIRVYPLHIALRVLPAAALLLVHCSQGTWPTEEVCQRRVLRWGFSLNTWREKPWTVLTCAFVHISSSHLLSNFFLLLATLAEFGAKPSLRDNLEEECTGNVLQRTIGSWVVMLVGGAVGGVGGQALYNQGCVRHRRSVADERFGTCASPGQDGAGLSFQLGEFISRAQGTLAKIIARAENYLQHLVADVQEEVHRACIMCGASAGVCALAGFNTVYYQQPLCAIIVVLPEVLSMRDVFREDVARRGWHVLVPGTSVGHAAHLGGFAVGASMGCAWRCYQRRRRSRRNAATGPLRRN